MDELLDTPIHYEIAGRDWWVQEMHDTAGNVVVVNLYNDDGYFVGEFNTKEEAVNAANQLAF